MKLFVWNMPDITPATHAVVVAISETVEQAREIARNAKVYDEHGKEVSEYYPVDTALGEPTRVLELPCAEWHSFFS